MELNEKNFIGKEVDFGALYAQHKKGPNGKEVYHLPTKGKVEKSCENCFFARDEKKQIIPCYSQTAKEKFGISKDQVMPTEIDGKQVGYYCTEWLYYAVL